MDVIWKPVYLDGIRSNYDVSEYGNVKNIKTGKMLLPYTLKESGRERVLLHLNGKKFYIKIYRLVYIAFKGPIPENMTVDHIDENRNNNHISNLRILSASDNIKSFLKNHPDHGFQKNISDDIIMKFFEKMKHGMYYKDAAKDCNISEVYAYNLLRGLRRKEIWSMYAPFPKSAHRKSYLSESDQMVAIADIIDGYSTREILNHINVIYNAKSIDAIAKLRKKLGIKDPKYFEESFIQDIDALIIQGNSNADIYKIMNIEFTTRISDFMARRRKYLGIPNNNYKYGNAEEVKLIRSYIELGMSNSEILQKIGKEKNQYYVDLFGRLRQEHKKQINPHRLSKA